MASGRRPEDLPEDEVASLPVEPSDALRGRVLAALDESTRYEGFVERFARLFHLPESRAREVLGAAYAVGGDGWVDAPIPGVRLFHFDGGEAVAAADCGLVHVAPGTRFPPHRHLGVEWMLVLAGRAEEDDGGEVWLPGDLVVREAESVHGYTALGDEPFLFAVVLHGGIEFGGLEAD